MATLRQGVVPGFGLGHQHLLVPIGGSILQSAAPELLLPIRRARSILATDEACCPACGALETVCFGDDDVPRPTAESPRPGFKVTKTADDPLPADERGFNSLMQIHGLPGPWIFQDITLNLDGWGPINSDCPKKSFCKVNMKELIRVMNANGSPQAASAAESETPGSTPKEGGSVTASARSAPRISTSGPCKVTAARKGKVDRHKVNIKLSECSICKLIGKIESTIEDCASPTWIDAANPGCEIDNNPARADMRIDYILLELSVSGDCLCKPIETWKNPWFGYTVGAKSKKSTYSYPFRWGKCPCDDPPPPSGGPPPSSPPVSIEPPPPPPPPVTPPPTTPRDGKAPGSGQPGAPVEPKDPKVPREPSDPPPPREPGDPGDIEEDDFDPKLWELLRRRFGQTF